MPYLGNIPATQFAELKYQDFTGGTGTSFTLNDPVGTAQELEVFVNNVRQEPGVAYTVSGTTLTMTGSIVATDDFYVVFQGKSTGTATHPAGQALTATDGTFTGDLTVDTNTLYVDSTNNEVGIGTLTPGGSLEVYKAGTSEVLIGTDNGGTAQLSLYENNDGTKEGLLKYDGTNNRIHLATSGAPNALVIPRDTGNVGIGQSSPVTLKSSTTLQVDGNAKLGDDNGRGLLSLGDISSTGANAGIWRGAAGAYAGTGNFLNLGGYDGITFTTGNSDIASQTERMRIDSSGHVGINNTSPGSYGEGELTIGNSTKDQYLNIVSGSANAAGVIFQDTTGTSIVGGIRYTHSDDVLSSWANGAERMRVQSNGRILFGKTSTGDDVSGFMFIPGDGGRLNQTSGSAACMLLNRHLSDGDIVLLRQANVTEGTISVSGSTVSYNGGHLSRFSQAADGSRITGLVKGTVMTNLDQMAVWSHDEVLWTADDELPDGVSVGDVKTAAFTEENEQLNCMAVSSVEGDANVAGVFVNWDEDDEEHTADMNVAMTGDMVIRIASGTTVARGDLLMSAGDGTAKPQGDDIVRSKTIAKVTSTTVSHTYDDGSYLVPCVLMAC